MAPKPLQLAKLTRPRLHKAVARERLFELLDEKREHPVVWIVGPPGAGKTTLAASYLEEASAPAIWYQIDPGDSDPATFFYYLKQAIESASIKKKGKPLPLLTPEYLPDLPGFARRFLREGLARLPEDAILVFDNYHDIAPDSTLHAPFKAALAEIPPGSNVIVLSRSDPPAAFADALLNQGISTVTWEDLRLTAEETSLLAATRGITDKKILRVLHDQSTGWMAGMTLMLERLRAGAELESLSQGETMDTVFNYFAGLIFDKSSDETREILMKAAFPPRINASLAEAVTGKPNAIESVEDLHRRHLFTDRVAGAEVSYQFHALFRSFLKSRAAKVFSEIQSREIAWRAAASLAAAGQIEPAFDLYAEAQDWESAEALLIESAQTLIGQGRWQTLAQWGDTIPAKRRDANPWVGYWLGRSKNPIDPVAARPLVEAAYFAFTRTGDEIGQLLCAITMLEGFFFEFEDCTRTDAWIARVIFLLETGIRPPTKEDELRVHSTIMMGATVREPKHSMLQACLHRVEELLREPIDPNSKVAAARMLHEYAAVSMDTNAVQIAHSVAVPLLSSPLLLARHASAYRHVEGYTHYLNGRYTQAFESFGAADAIADEHAIPEEERMNWFQRGLCERRSGLLDKAEVTIHRIESFSVPAWGHLDAGLRLLKAVVAFDRGNLDQAIEGILRSYNIYEKLGQFNGAVLVGTVGLNMAVSGGRFDTAEKLIRQLRAVDYGPIARNYLAAVTLNQAWLAHRRGDSATRDRLLSDALRAAGDERARVRFRWYVNALAELLPVALNQDIESNTVRSLAREFAVVPVPGDTEKWPWPVKVCTLGRFELLVDGVKPEFSRKAPRKVLALLKAIIAYGAKDVPEQKLVDALWPDEEGDAARRAMVTTLHRLRRLLVHDKAIRQAEGKLTLDQGICWIDALAFEQRLVDPEERYGEWRDAIPLYRGTFLAQDASESWIVPARERLRDKFIRAVGQRCEKLEAADRHADAVELYRRGIDADPLVEPFYQGLMRCYDKLNRSAEAASTYRRLRETLSIVLGVPPSSASQRLFETLRLS
jgi:LuxR family transcriptional regulator, maltose regulon positive regulatory protein